MTSRSFSMVSARTGIFVFGALRRLKFNAAILSRRSGAALFVRRWRYGTRPSLPGIVIIGVNKGGTSALFEYLSQHPEVVPAATKEVHFFDFNYGRGMKWYRNHFLIQEHSKAVPIEATPSYFDHPSVPLRIARDLPNCRFILLLRDPVARAYSHYWHERYFGRITVSFSDALRQELETIDVERRNGKNLPWDFRRFLRRSMYAASIERWFNAVARDRILILRSEDLQANPLQQLGKVCEFARLGSYSKFDLSPRNRGRYAHEIPEGARIALEGALADDALRVKTLLGEYFVRPAKPRA